MKKVWRLWCKALGEKATNNDIESDVVAIIRTLILFSYLITNCFIIAGVIRHYDNQQIQCGVSTGKEENRVLE
ncbi:hypothetical protein PQC12_gp002 [Synechococcus phage S-SCSM1]|uniref:Uncharacterized protein n=1 Tax=Synechococcus phage S-SCSM1 TaxID=2588487 RepID=A0A6M2ZHA6_9CAUD|nr:hypothetical protein PQC12_gp002 [Synechococcus phage S-SCSM1]QFG06258.1 hypothetical protein SSCSM1_2 [Synechococcus phage S-SCSM1]